MELLNNFDEKNIILFPKIHGKNPEFLIKSNLGDIFIEQTSLIFGETERKLQEVFNAIAKEIYNNLKNETMISMNIDTNKLIWTNEGIDVSKSIEKVVSSIQKINLTPFFNLHNIETKTLDWHLESLSTLERDKRLIELIDILSYYDDMGKYLADNSKTEPSKSFLQNSVNDISECPIVNFFSIPSKYPIIQIQDKLLFPSQVAEFEKRAWFNRLNKKIKDKIMKKQMPSGSLNLLLLKTDIWCFPNYNDLDPQEYQEISKIIESIFQEIKDKSISNVIIYRNNLSEILIFTNPNADKKLDEKEVMNLFKKI